MSDDLECGASGQEGPKRFGHVVHDRYRALGRALNQVEMYDVAHEVNTGRLDDLGEVVLKITELGEVNGPAWWAEHGEPLLKAIQAGEYGPYQETDDTNPKA